MAVVDHKGRIRNLPNNPRARKSVLAGVRRGVRHQELEVARAATAKKRSAKRPEVPQTMSRHKILTILEALGFEHIGASHFVSKKTRRYHSSSRSKSNFNSS